jgi:flagellar hook-length control protein FliK
MNSSKLSPAATAPANAAAAVDGLAWLSPAGAAPVDGIGADAATEFQLLIEDLLPAAMDQDSANADAGLAGDAVIIVADTPVQDTNPELSTAQLLLQLPPLVPVIQPSSNAVPQELSSIEAAAPASEDVAPLQLQSAGVVASLQSESADANDQTLPGKVPGRVHADGERHGRDGVSAWLTDAAMPALPLKLQEAADRPANPQGHQGEKGPHVPTPQSLPLVAAALAAAASARELPSLPRMENPVGTAAWRQELANTVNLMIDRGEQSATLRLSPEHLGPLEVRIAIREGETSLWFGAAHADTRHALEQALPRLREQFASAGLSLGQSSVSQGSPQEPKNLRAAMISGISAASSDAAEIAAPAGRVTSRITGLIDTYV